MIFGWRSFELYPPQVQVAGATPIQVPLTDHTFDLYAMLAAITERTRLIFVCNPNNPTSTVVDPDALTRFVEAVPPHILIAIDEAYVEYIRDGMAPDSLGLARKPTAMSLCCALFRRHTGWPALRVGYAVGQPELITALDKVYVPFTVSSIAQAAAIASLHAADELLARTDAVVAERSRVSAELRAAGFTFPPSQANFVWLPLASRTPDFVERAADARIVVRPYGTDGVRVTIGAPEENDALLGLPATGTIEEYAMSLARQNSPNSNSAATRFPTPSSTSSGRRSARDHRRHDRRVEGRRVPHRPQDERPIGEGRLVR